MIGVSDLLNVYNMKEIKAETRIRLIKKLGIAINYEYASNLTEEVVEELVNLLESTTTDNDDMRAQLKAAEERVGTLEKVVKDLSRLHDAIDKHDKASLYQWVHILGRDAKQALTT
jgi:hypothetical protein